MGLSGVYRKQSHWNGQTLADGIRGAEGGRTEEGPMFSSRASSLGVRGWG